MIVLKFRNYTYFVNDAYGIVLFAILGYGGRKVVKRLLKKYNSRNNSRLPSYNSKGNPSPIKYRGGGKVEDIVNMCLAEDGVYEIKNNKIIEILKRLLSNTNSKEIIVFDAALFVTAALIADSGSTPILEKGANSFKYTDENKIKRFMDDV